MENFGTNETMNTNINHDTIQNLLTVAGNERLFGILDNRTQERLNRFVYRYTKGSLDTIEGLYNTDTLDEEYNNNRGR